MLDCWIMAFRQTFAILFGIISLGIALDLIEQVTFYKSVTPGAVFFATIFGAAAWLAWP